MQTDFASILPALGTFLGTYLLHSTLLLCSAWIVAKCWRNRSHAASEHLWKWAAVAGLISVPLQLSFDSSSAVLTVPIARASSQQGLASANAVLEPVEFDSVASDCDRSEHELTDIPINGETPYALFDGTRLGGGQSEIGPSRLGVRWEEEDPHPAFGHPLPGGEEFDAAWTAESARTSALWLANASIVMVCLLALASFLLLACRHVRFHYRIAGCSQITHGPARATLNALLGELAHQRPVTLIRSDRSREPLAVGVFRWRILLPPDIEKQLAPDELRALLAHELAHLKRGDQWWLWIGGLLSTLFGFQPLNRLARREWQRAAEFRCDDWAVQHAVKPLSLARCLTRVAEWKIEHHAQAMGLAMSGTHSDLSHRVERLVEGVFTPHTCLTRGRHVAIALVAVFLMAVLTCFGPRMILPANATTIATRNSAMDSKDHDGDIADDSLPSNATTSSNVASDAGSDLTAALDALEAEIDLLDRDWQALHTAAMHTADPYVLDSVASLTLKMKSLSRRRAMLASLRPLTATAPPEGHTGIEEQ